jgi:hypothetical protein
VIRTIVAVQRITFQVTVNAIPVRPVWPMWPSIAVPIDAPNTTSAEAMPPITSVAAMSGNANSRLARKPRSVGTS